MTEQWRDVPGYEGRYEVSSLGRVRGRSGLRKLHTAKDGGYLSVGLTRSRADQRTWTVHRLVMEAFVGPMPEGLEIRHLDGNPQNARLENLRYGTSGENKRDKRRHGTDHNVRKTHCLRGHPYAGENLYVIPSTGGRMCRTCERARKKRLTQGPASSAA